MKLFEFEARKLFEKYDIPVPEYGVASTVDEVVSIAKNIGFPVVLKAQVLVGGRGKAGGIKFAYNIEEAKSLGKSLLGSKIKGELVERLIVSKAVEIEREMFISIILDRAEVAPLILASSEGGVDIEELAARAPEKIIRVHVNPLIGIQPYHVRKIVNKLNLTPEQSKQMEKIIYSLYRVFTDFDCELAEINPLAIDKSGNLVALDAKVIIDDNALFRRKEFAGREERELTEFEAIARKEGFSYVELDGNIGIIGNGAGLTMATMDMVYLYGGRPANFLDIGGGARSEIVERAVSLLLRHPRVEVIFINILGGITRCDEVAKGLVRALKKFGAGKKLVVRMVGTNEEEGKRILREAGIYSYDSMEEAAKKTVELAGGG